MSVNVAIVHANRQFAACESRELSGIFIIFFAIQSPPIGFAVILSNLLEGVATGGVATKMVLVAI